MNRDAAGLGRSPFDLLVVGGGIYGAWTAYDAALRGLSVALVEQDDWAAGTSSASSKLIHGGLRYLEHVRLGLVRKSLNERRRLFQLAPHAVEPLRFVVPVYRGGRVGLTRMRLGLALYDLLAGPDQPVDGHRVLGAKQVAREYPFLRTKRLSGALSYGDCRTDDARLVLEVVDGALQAGAVVVNRARATELLRDGPRVSGARVEDLETGTTIAVTATVTVIAAGPWSDRLLRPALGETAKPLMRFSKGVHLVLPALETEDAFLLLSRDRGRVLFLVPWYGRTLVGTTDDEFDGDPSDLRVERTEVDGLLEQANRVLNRGARWTGSDVLSAFAGIRVLAPAPGGRSSDVTRQVTIEEPLPGVLAPVGGKYTSARADSARIVDRAIARSGRAPARCGTAERPTPWSPAANYGVWSDAMLGRGLSLGLDAGTAETCARRYGTRIDALFEILRDRPDLARRIVPALPFCRAELVHAARNEMALSLPDVLRRRVPVLLLTGLEDATITDAAALVGDELGWSADRRDDEIAAVFAVRWSMQP